MELQRRSRRRLFALLQSDVPAGCFPNAAYLSDYLTRLGIVSWGAYASARFKSADDRWTVNGGVRMDGSNYSSEMSKLWKQLSPASLALLSHHLGAVAQRRRRHLLSAARLYRFGIQIQRRHVGKQGVEIYPVENSSVGMEYNVKKLVFTVEGFYKRYDHTPLSVVDQIPLACKGNDYGIVGNELLVSTAWDARTAWKHRCAGRCRRSSTSSRR